MKRAFAIVVIAVSLLAIGFLRPPVEGTYHCWLFSHLNGSSGYLILHDGNIALVNRSDGIVEHIPHIGNYTRLPSGLVRITIEDSEMPYSDDVSVGWLGFQFNTIFGKGAPEELCIARRELLPWILNKLNEK